MRKDSAKNILRLDPGMDQKIEAVAVDAMRALWDETVDKADRDPNESRLVTPAMCKHAIEVRLRDYLGRGVILPIVTVGLNAAKTSFVVDIRPGDAGHVIHPTMTPITKRSPS